MSLQSFSEGLVYDAKMKGKKGRSGSRDSSRGKVEEVHLQLDPKRRYVGIGKKVPASSETNVNSYMQINRLQHPQREPARRHQRRRRLPLPLIPSLIATMKIPWIIPHRG